MIDLLHIGDRITCTMSNGTKYIVTLKTPEGVALGNDLLWAESGWSKCPDSLRSDKDEQ